MAIVAVLLIYKFILFVRKSVNEQVVMRLGCWDVGKQSQFVYEVNKSKTLLAYIVVTVD